MNNQPASRSRNINGIKSSVFFGLSSAAFLLALIIGGMLVPPGASVTELAPRSVDAVTGEVIYRGEGCGFCHSRMVRPADDGMGSKASAEIFAGERYGLLGSSRIGPDLQNIANSYSEELLVYRLRDPDAIQPDTIMPSYSRKTSDEIRAIVEYLRQSMPASDPFEAIRETNEIEPMVPDSVLESVSNYTDPRTGLIEPPVPSTEESLIIARGIYNSRCAACHGVDGLGDGPMSWKRNGEADIENSIVPRVLPTDFTSSEFAQRSRLMIYWRISEGVPGTEMPSWKVTLSEAARWYLVILLDDWAHREFAEENTVVGEELQGSVAGVEGPFGSEALDDWTEQGSTSMPEDVINNQINTALSPNETPSGGNASEEEGADRITGYLESENPSDGEPAGEGI